MGKNGEDLWLFLIAGVAMNRAALARMPACSGARRADHAEPMVLDFPRTRAYPCYYFRVIVILLILIKIGGRRYHYNLRESDY